MYEFDNLTEIDSGNEEPVNSPGKGAMPTPGSKATLAAQRNKIPPSQLPRSVNHLQGESVSSSQEDGSSNAKVHSAPVRRSPAKPSVNTTSPKRPSSSLSTAPRKNDKLENLYSMKKKRYQQLRKDLMDKQKIAQELYNEMSQLREKVIASGTKDPGKLEDLRLEVGSPQPLPVTSATGPSDQSNVTIEKLAINREFLENLEGQLQEIPKKSQNICRELLKKQLSFVTFVSSRLIKTNNEETDTENGMTNVDVEMITQLEVHQKDYESLQACLDEIETTEMKAITDLMQNMRGILQEIENNQTKQNETNTAEALKELQERLNVTTEELQAEREKTNQGKERLRQVHAQLQRATAKIRELESHVDQDDGKIQQMQANIKTLENQMKQKEQATELKLKDMQKTMKNNESLVAKVEKQRDSFETRLVELKEKMNIKETEALNRIKELSEKLDAVGTELIVEREKRHRAEESLSELGERYKQLEEKSNQFCKLSEKNKDFTITEGSHSDNEVRLFNELQETREELKMQKEIVLQLQQEKEEIVAVMHQAANQEDAKEKLAAELVFKTNELKNLMSQYSELKKVAKNAQERSGILERQLIDIQSRLHSQSKEGGKAGLSAHAIELQQQVSDLRNELAKVIQQKEELETVLTQKQLELEQRDRVMREQSKFLKVRDELLDMLEGNVQQENGEMSTSDENNEYIEQINKQIAAKTEAIQELHATLESKQLQIMRLEKMVKLMEDQQDRAQAQRTRLENRIADLQHELQKNKEQRGKGFSIL
ncbi:uncharacterized protein LOC143188839 [Calliopsis andreniformis]|uniref:uncharacterized protein LOC143188839 n=1 Tax=Calliopsis andreniformis TaxID=337506 RepID=UPI003FCE5D9F